MTAGRVRSRRVYYFAGFDTRSARFYHQLYQGEAAAQQPVGGSTYDVGPLTPAGMSDSAWIVHARRGEEVAVETRYRFMAWNDIVRRHWPQSTWRVAAGIPAFFWRFARTGALCRTRQLSRPFFWIILTPLVMTALAIVLATLAGGAVAVAWPSGGGYGMARSAAALGAGLATLAAGLWYAERVRAFWLMRAWTFLWRWICCETPELSRRLDDFAASIDSDLDDGSADEYLLIGHSAGTMVAVSVMARLLALAGDHHAMPRLKLVTLGNVHPFFGLVPRAGWYREEMRRVADSGITWVDITAPGDPLCYALVDALAASGLAPAAAGNYRVKSARFDRMFEPARYADLKRDYFRIHFQYLMASERPVDNDYFALTAGPRPLALEPSAPAP